ncbi:hypothetical protein F0A16_06210 [Salinicola corii]|uniref:GspL cytoplasmic actin-ATPase-like domain-containing protein n=1 Tax=Salinicola corii TaxID=2606937 RepID=A0A640WHP7_9GAMM|nr:type II secretion system protein GspL [Salinicola corii]KAA0019905.1 hypothetical protein F0A16_06210 [Salinicola corii]
MIRLPQWRRSAAPQSAPRLVIRIGGRIEEDTPAWQSLFWVIAQDHGTTTAQGHVTPSDQAGLAELRRHSQALPGVLLLDPASVSHFHLSIPPGLKRREWPTLLEEQLCRDPEQMELYPLATPRGQLEVIAVERQHLAMWRDWCRELDLDIEYWGVAFMAQPDAPEADQLSVLPDLTHWLFKAREGTTRHWLAWPRQWPLEQLPPAWRTHAWYSPLLNEKRADEALPPAGFEADITATLRFQAEHLPPSLPRLPPVQGERTASRMAGLRQLPRGMRRLGFAAPVLLLLHGGLLLTQHLWDHQQQDQLQQQALAARLRPDAPPGDANWRALRQRLDALQALEMRNRRIAEFQTALMHRFDPQRWQLEALRVDGQRLIVDWQLRRSDDASSSTARSEITTHIDTRIGELEWQGDSRVRVSVDLETASLENDVENPASEKQA